LKHVGLNVDITHNCYIVTKYKFLWIINFNQDTLQSLYIKGCGLLLCSYVCGHVAISRCRRLQQWNGWLSLYYRHF